MHIFLFIFYSLVCAFAIVKMPFIRNSGIRPTLLLLFFALHVVTGLVHNFIAYRYYPEHGDIWDYFWKSFMYRHRLVSDLHTFLANNASWTHLSHNGLIYVQMILNLFSLDHLDINTLLFSFPVFLGNIALFRVFRNRFPNDPLTAFTVFLLPSVLFWTSCIHREGILYMLLGFLLLGLHRMMTGSYHPTRLLRSILCFLLIFYFRSGFALTLLPAVFAWWYLEKPRLRPLLARIAIAITGTALLLILATPGLHLPGTLAAWQDEFYALYGHSRLSLPKMDGSWPGLFRAVPAAALNGLLEPLPGTGGQPIYLGFSLELLAIWTITALAVIKNARRPRQTMQPRNPARQSLPDEARILPPQTPSAPAFGTAPMPHHPGPTPSDPAFVPAPIPSTSATPPIPPFSLFALIFTLTGMLLIGLFVPFAGTIVRYRSIYLLFLLAPPLHTLTLTRPFMPFNAWLSRHAFYKL